MLLALLGFSLLINFRNLSSSGAVNISLVTLIIPVVAVVLGHEHLIELLLIALGMSVIDGRHCGPGAHNNYH